MNEHIDKMSKTILISQLGSIVKATRENRLRVSNTVVNNKALFLPILELVFACDDKISIKAASVLEYVCMEKLNWMVPHLDYFCENIHRVQFDSAIRPVAKICELLAKAYSSKKGPDLSAEIKEYHIARIIEVGFDWLIGTQKVAAKAYTMEMLFLFGKKRDWIHEELKLIIEQNISKESAAYKARGKKILDWINKK